MINSLPNSGRPPGSIKLPLLSKDLIFTTKVNQIMKENAPDSYRFIVCDEDSVTGSGFGGIARAAIDAPEMKAKLDDRLVIASMSKTITGIAVLATLQKKNLSPDTLVAPFLPTDWTLHDEVKKLTFRDFLTHRTGFHWGREVNDPKQDASDYEGIKKIVAQKPFNPIKSGHDYRNINFAIMRIILPYLDAYDRFAKKVSLNVRAGVPMDRFLAERYVALVVQRVLEPSGVTGAGVDPKTLVQPAPAPNVAVLAYPYKKTAEKGIEEGDQTLWCGASGWCLSVADIAKVLQTVLFSEVVLSEKSRAALMASYDSNTNSGDRGMGMYAEVPLAGSNVYSHGAWIPYNNGAMLAGWLFYFEKSRRIVVALSNAGHNPDVANWADRMKSAYAEVYV
jgi:CubicO group peptidase (beta-lactamase class C family)